jgi:hypothetical protein
VIGNHGGVVGVLMRCLEFDGTIEEYLSNTPKREIQRQWDAINMRWKVFLAYQKDLAAMPAQEEISS